MRLLFDENLSFRLVRALETSYPDSAHVREVGLLGAGDARIWAYAGEQHFLLASKDTGFYQRSVLYGPPPKVICCVWATRRHPTLRSCFARNAPPSSGSTKIERPLSSF